MTTPLPPNVPPARFVSPETVPWQDAPGYANPGAEEKILFHDQASGTYVRLLRWPAGFVTGDEPLRHDDMEEFAWVLEGSSVSVSSGEAYAAGTFCVVPAGVLHGPFTSADGITLLEVRRPVALDGAPAHRATG